MNARSISCTLLGAMMVVTLMMNDPTAHGAGDQDRISDLETRLESLEQQMKYEAKEQASLKSKISDLERLARQSASSSSSRSSLNDFSQLKRAVRTVESKVNTNGQSATQLRREIDRLKLNLSTLENTVERLK